VGRGGAIFANWASVSHHWRFLSEAVNHDVAPKPTTLWVRALTLILELMLIFLPPSIFIFKLRACQEKGLRDYTVFAARYVNDFEKKWLSGGPAPAALARHA
jgi:hypothetical protein